MPEPATSDQVELEALLDELVPPPGPRWRRVVLWTAFVGLLAALVWATISGTIVAKVSTGVDSWGGAGPVSISTFVINDSRVDIVVTDSPRPQPDLTLLGYTTRPPTPDGLPAGSQTDPFPLRLQPGERADLDGERRTELSRVVNSREPHVERAGCCGGSCRVIWGNRTLESGGVDAPHVNIG